MEQWVEDIYHCFLVEEFTIDRMFVRIIQHDEPPRLIILDKSNSYPPIQEFINRLQDET